jgi:asparagine N-glycosylation enzyme membrane subunit Stt3
LSAIVLIALILRVFFAYGTSADSGFALSGGSDAAYHLRVIEHILTNGTPIVTDSALNYPFGGLNYNPPLFDWAVAAAAFPLTLFGFSAAEAASAALAFSTAIVGALTCIPVYLLAKEMFSRRAAIVASAFFAISSVAIVQTVFSNGTESAFFVFFFVLMTLFLLRAVKALKRPAADVSAKNNMLAPFKDKKVFRNMIFATLSLIALQLSWIGFISVIMLISFIMVVQTVADRIRGDRALSYVSLYGTVMILSLLVVSLYYVLLMGMTMLIAGPLCLALLLVVISLLIASHRVWVITIPVSIVILAAVFTVTAFFIPSLHDAMTSGFYPYAEGKFRSLMTLYNGVTLSTQAIYAGMVTMWFSFAVAARRLIRLPKKASSPSYMFITMWFVAMLFFSWRSVDLAYLAAPMYAIGTGVVIMWLLRWIKLKDYLASFKGATPRSIWRKVLKPAPFIAVLATVLMLLVPNVLYAVDASIPSNEKANYTADMHLGASSEESINYLGATNYYIKDNNWSLSEAWAHYSENQPDAALATWLDYGAEAIARGGFDVVADLFGGGAAAASNILLSSPSGSTASMIVRLIDHDRSALDVISGQTFTDLKRIIEDGKVPVSMSADATNVDYVKFNPNIFGATDLNISGENAMYIVAVYYMTTNLTDGEMAEIYNAVCNATGHQIGYVGVTGTMLPIYYGDSSIFSTLAFLNDYHLDSNGAVPKYYTAGVPYQGYYYTYTDRMYETMIWKSLVGMSLEDYKAMTNDPGLSINALIRGLMLSDGTYKAYPGFGMSTFDIDAWWATYNPEDDYSGEWELMDAYKAQALQEEQGGIINYFGGMAFLKYNGVGETVSGTVNTPAPKSEGIGGMTVALFDADGNLIGQTKTNENGEYGIMVPNSASFNEIGVYCGSIYAMEVYRGPAGSTDIKIPWAELEGKITGLDAVSAAVTDVLIELEGKYSGKVYTLNPDAIGDFAENVVPDTYTVTMTLNDVSIYTGTFTLYPGIMNVGEINVKTVAVDVTVKNSYGAVVPDIEVFITYLDADGTTKVADSAITDSSGVAKMNVAPGEYLVQQDPASFNGWMLTSSSLSSNTAAFTATMGSTSKPSVVKVDATEVTIEVDGTKIKEGDVITLTNGVYAPYCTYTASVKATAAGTHVPVLVPTGDYGNAETYTATVIKTMSTADTVVMYAKVSDTDDINAADWISGWDWTGGEPWTDSRKVTVTMTYDKDNKPVYAAGVVSLIGPNNEIINIPIAGPEDDDDKPSVTVLLPGTAEYTVYAYANLPEKKAWITSLGETDETLDIKLADAIALSGSVYYTSSTTKISFVPVFITATIDDNKYTIVTCTAGAGYYVMVPKEKAYSCTTELVFGNFLRPTSAPFTSSVTQTANNRTVNLSSVIVNRVSEEINTLDVTKNTDTPIKIEKGDGRLNMEIGVSNAKPGEGTARIDLKTFASSTTYVAFSSGNATFSTSSSGTFTGELIISISAPSTSSESRTSYVYVKYDAETGVTPGIEMHVISNVGVVEIIHGIDEIKSKNGTFDMESSPIDPIGDVDIAMAAGLSPGEYDMTLTNNNPYSVQVMLLSKEDGTDFGGNGAEYGLVIAPASSETITGVIYDVGKGEVDMSVYPCDYVADMKTSVEDEYQFGVEITIDDEKGTILLKNTTSHIKYVMLRAIDDTKMTFKAGSAAAVIGSSIVKVDAEGSTTVTVSSETGTLVGISLAEITVTSSGNATRPNADGTYNLTPGTYTLAIGSKDLQPGVTWYYYTGSFVVYADTSEIDIIDKIEEVMVVTVVLEDEDDEIALTGDTILKDSTGATRIYFMKLVDSKFSSSISVKNLEGTKVAYMDITDTDITPATPIEITLEDAVTVAGYVGRAAAGTMTIKISDGSKIATVTTLIKNGEYEVLMPKGKIEYTFSAVITDSVNGTPRDFLTNTPIKITGAYLDKIMLDDGTKAVLNMEVVIGDLIPSDYDDTVDVSGKVKDADGKPLGGVTVTYEIDGTEGSTTTNASGNYVIKVPALSTNIDITEVTKDGYETKTALGLSPGNTEDFTLNRDVIITHVSTTFSSGSAEITMAVTNNSGSTVVMVPSKSWIMPTFTVDGTGSTNYAVIPNDGTSHTVILVAGYDPDKTGSGSESMSVTVQNLLGTTLLTKVLDTKDTTNEGTIDDIEDSGGSDGAVNRVSKNEYGFAVTFTNDTDKWVPITLSSIIPTGLDDDWLVSIVDSNNVVLEGGDLDVIIPAHSSVTYYIRLINADGDVSTDPLPVLKMVYEDTSGAVTVELVMEPTDLSIGSASASGDNVFNEQAGIPAIVWAFAALSILMMLLIAWMGIRRGVFLRKR